MRDAAITPIGQFLGNAERLMAANGDLGALRSNSLLRYDEWKRIDDKVVQIARERLRVVSDIQAAGLTVDLGGLGVLISEYEKIGDMSPAQQSLAGVTEGEEDLPAWSLTGVPVPITHKDFRINVRQLLASRRTGQPLDTTAITIATRKVVELLESTVFNGSGIQIGANRTVPGFLNFADRVTGSLTNNDWANAATTGENILSDTLDMIAAAKAVNFYGPYVMYIPEEYEVVLMADFKTNSDKSIISRLLELSPLTAIRPASALPTGNVLLVQMTEEVLDMPVGADIQVVEWDTKGGLSMHFKVMTAMVPRLKSDANGATGIVHFS